MKLLIWILIYERFGKGYGPGIDEFEWSAAHLLIASQKLQTDR